MSELAQEILLVADDSLLAEITRFRLELLGSSVASVPSAEEALDWLADRLPMLIVVDQVLPGMDGTKLVKRLKGAARTASVPVLLLSNRANLNDVQHAFDAGVDDYLVTPFDPLVLERKVEGLCAVTTTCFG